MTYKHTKMTLDEDQKYKTYLRFTSDTIQNQKVHLTKDQTLTQQII